MSALIAPDRVAAGQKLKARPNIGKTLRHAAMVCSNAAAGLPSEFRAWHTGGQGTPENPKPIPVPAPTPEQREAFAERAKHLTATANWLQGLG